MTEYTFGYGRNSYFSGHDGRVSRPDGRSITINAYDRRMAVNVKDHNSFYSGMPEEVERMARELDPELEFGGPIDSLYEAAREGWWDDATETAEFHGFGKVWSAGRSGGWATIDGTEGLVGDFATDYGDRGDAEEMTELRDRFLALAFDLVEMIEHSRDWFYEMVREEYAELEARRERCLVRGDS